MSERDSRLPFTVLMPDTANQPIEVHDHSVGLHMALVEKSYTKLLDQDWDGPGVYLLFDALQPDGSYGVYVGKAPAGVRARLTTHDAKKSWSRALLIRRATLHGLTSAHAGWLEGDLHDLLKAATKAKLHNIVPPGDDTVPSYDLGTLESFRDPIVRVMRLLGYSPDSADDEPSVSNATTGATKPGRPKGKQFYGVTVAEIIQAGLLTGHEQLISTRTGSPATAQLNPDGSVSYNGQVYATPSAAGVAVRGQATNGWDFWAVEVNGQTRRLSALRADYQAGIHKMAPRTP
jgi:hypothetical protein